MQTVISTIKLPHAMCGHHLYLARYNLTRQQLVYSLLHSRQQLPLMTPALRLMALALQSLVSTKDASLSPTHTDIASSLAGGKPTRSVFEAISRHANIALVAAKAIENLTLSQQLKFVQSMIDRSKLAEQLLISAGAVGRGGEYIVTPEMIVDLCHNSRSAGPEDSELMAVRVIRAWIAATDAMVTEARTSKELVGIGLDGTSVAGMVAVHAAIHILEFLLNVVRVCDHAITDPSNTPMANFAHDCVNGLRSVAATLFALPTVANLTALQRLCSVAANPWVKSAIVGRISVAYDQALSSVEQRKYELGAWSMWPECHDSSLIDLDFDGIEPTLLPRTTAVDPSIMHDYVLYSELAFATGFQVGVVNTLIDDIWAVMAAADTCAALTRSATKQGTGVVLTCGTSVDYVPPSRDAVREMSALPRALPGYPSMTVYDARSVVLPGNRPFRFLGLNRWQYYTQAALARTTVETSEHAPLMITDGAQSSGIKLVPQVLPLFHILDEGEVPRTPSIDTLAHLWQTTVEELRRNITSLNATDRNPTLRAWADALRFVGLLCIAPISNSGQLGAGRAVVPSCGHYYHADPQLLTQLPAGEAEGVETCFHSPIDIGSLKGGAHHLVLYPFACIPGSARLETMHDHLQTLPLMLVHDHEAAVRWKVSNTDTDATIDTTPVRIFGWTFPPSEIADLVLVPVPHHSDDYYELQGDTEVRPTHASPINAVVTLLPDGDPVQMTLASDTSITTAETPIPAYIVPVT